MHIPWWTVAGLAGFSGLVTGLAFWLATRFRARAVEGSWSPSGLLPHLIWAALVCVSGIVATRYIERVQSTLAGYLVFSVTAFLLSYVRGWLYLRHLDQKPPVTSRGTPKLRTLAKWFAHHATYPLAAAFLLLFLGLTCGRSANAILLVPLTIGALLPDLDSHESPIGRLLPCISRRVEARYGHLEQCHTPAMLAITAFLAAPLIPLIGMTSWLALLLGAATHLGLDLLDKRGIMLLWPIRHTRYSLLSDKALSPGSIGEPWLLLLFTTGFVLLLRAADLNQAQPIPPSAPSYEGTLEQYRSLQGRQLVTADVEGVWQPGNRRVAGRFEVLGVTGTSYVLLDRYTETVFSAGLGMDDDLYLDQLSLHAGSAIQVKPVLMTLHEQQLLDVLPVLYQMQREPGLWHIFVSGEISLDRQQETASAELLQVPDIMRVRRIMPVGERSYRLSYCSAADLITLANLRVEGGELVIVATYVVPPDNPPATPLPTPPTTPEADPSSRHSRDSQ